MSRNLIIVAILILAVLVGGYLYFNKSGNLYNTNNPSTPKSSTATNKTSQIPPAGTSIVINEQNASGELGIATISESNGKIVVNLKLTGASTQTPQPAHLHKGTCEVPEEVIYPLTDVINGESETILDIDMDKFNSKLSLVLNVHKSAEEISVYTSCGDVSSQ